MAGVEVVSPFSVVVAARDSRRAYASVIALVALAAAVVCVAVVTSGSGGDRFTALAQRHQGSGAPSARMPPTVCAHLIAGQTSHFIHVFTPRCCEVFAPPRRCCFANF